MKMTSFIAGAMAMVLVSACDPAVSGQQTGTQSGAMKPTARPVIQASLAAPDFSQPRMRWSARPKGATWTQAALTALKTHGAALPATVPADIDAWCPAYRTAGPDQRRAFWAGMLSALSKHESTYRASAVGGGGKWFGLLQISPATARGYGCRAKSGGALKNGSDNLSCAIRIMAKTVPRDGVIAQKRGRWRGVAADWGPMRVSSKRNDMQSWLRERKYCKLESST